MPRTARRQHRVGVYLLSKVSIPQTTGQFDLTNTAQTGGPTGAIFVGENVGDQAGFSVAPAFNVNGDVHDRQQSDRRLPDRCPAAGRRQRVGTWSSVPDLRADEPDEPDLGHDRGRPEGHHAPARWAQRRHRHPECSGLSSCRANNRRTDTAGRSARRATSTATA